MSWAGLLERPAVLLCPFDKLLILPGRAGAVSGSQQDAVVQMETVHFQQLGQTVGYALEHLRVRIPLGGDNDRLLPGFRLILKSYPSLLRREPVPRN